MTRSTTGTMLDSLSLTAGGSLPLYRQLYKQLRELILSGGLPVGARLPSSRALAEEIDVSRTTVLNAYDQLEIEGFLETRIGSGTFVGDFAPDLRPPRPPSSPTPDPIGSLSARGERLAAGGRVVRDRGEVLFAPGHPDTTDFPVRTWNRLVARHARKQTPRGLSRVDAAGVSALRAAIAGYASTSRGLRCDAEQIVVLPSSHLGIELAARLLTDRGDRALLEEPGYIGARVVLDSAGLDIAPVPVDEHGMRIGSAPRRSWALAYVTPSHHFPLGAVLSLKRRLELLRWADRNRAWIVEDDYNAEYRYRGQPIGALQGLSESGRVVYLGTFNKLLFPNLRVSYLVAPRSIVDAVVSARAVLDSHCQPVLQHALADFIAEGHFGAHVRRKRAAYRDRQNALVTLLRESLGTRVTVDVPDSGVHLVVRLPGEIDDEAISVTLREHGVEAPALSKYYLGEEKHSGLLLGFAASKPEDMRAGVDRIKEAIENSMAG